MSYGIAFSLFATSSTWLDGTNRNSGFGSTKRVINHGQAMRSTRARSRVTHFMALSALFECEGKPALADDAHDRVGQQDADRADGPHQHDGYRDDEDDRCLHHAHERGTAIPVAPTVRKAAAISLHAARKDLVVELHLQAAPHGERLLVHRDRRRD